MNAWLSDYLEYVKDIRSPLVYHKWVGLSIISATIGRKVYLQLGHFQTVPNIYVILLGPSGLGKGNALAPARELLFQTKVVLAPNSTTREGFLSYMLDKESIINGKSYNNMMILATELGSFLKDQDRQFRRDLTGLYDCEIEGFLSQTKTVPSVELKNPGVTLLGATTPDDLLHIFPASEYRLGMLGRCIMVFADQTRKVPLIPPNPDKKLALKLSNQLRATQKIIGTMKFSATGELAFAAIQQTKTRRYIHSVFEGFAARRHIHILKVAMLLSLIRSNRMLIDGLDLEEAEELIAEVEVDMEVPFLLRGRNKHGRIMEDIVRYVLRNTEKKKQTTRSEIASIFIGDLDDQDVTQIERTLSKAKILKVDPELDGETVYHVGPNAKMLMGRKT